MVWYSHLLKIFHSLLCSTQSISSTMGINDLSQTMRLHSEFGVFCFVLITRNEELIVISSLLILSINELNKISTHVHFTFVLES